MAGLESAKAGPIGAAILFSCGLDGGEFGFHHVPAFAEGTLELRGFEDEAHVVFLRHGNFLQGIESTTGGGSEVEGEGMVVAIGSHERDVVFLAGSGIDEGDEMKLHHVSPRSGGEKSFGKVVCGGCHDSAMLQTSPNGFDLWVKGNGFVCCEDSDFFL